MARIFGLILFGFGLWMIYEGFNDEFSIGQTIQSTLTKNSRAISDTVIRKYDYFDAFKNRVIPILGGVVFGSLGALILFGKDND